MNNRLKIKIEGKNPDYFFKELIKNKIDIYDIEKNKKELIIIIDFKDLEKLKKIKTSYKIKIIRYYGISHLKQLIKEYYLLIISIIIGFIIMIILSNMIWKIEIINSNKKLSTIIKEDLKRFGIRKYHLKKNYKEREIIKAKIKEKEHDILEWIEIEEKGTKYIIKIEERKKLKKEEKCENRHIVAKKNAIITDINVKSGEIIKKKNDYVTKGEIIVSGLIHNKEDIVKAKCTKGEIYGETWYKVKVLVPKISTNKRLLNEKKYGIFMKIFTKEKNIGNTFNTFKKKEYNIIEGKIIPVKVSFATYQKTEITKRVLTEKELENKALELAEKKLKQKLKTNEKILNKKVLKKTLKNSKIEVDVFVKIKENITDYLEIGDINIEEMNQKKE